MLISRKDIDALEGSDKNADNILCAPGSSNFQWLLAEGMEGVGGGDVFPT